MGDNVVVGFSVFLLFVISLNSFGGLPEGVDWATKELSKEPLKGRTYHEETIRRGHWTYRAEVEFQLLCICKAFLYFREM